MGLGREMFWIGGGGGLNSCQKLSEAGFTGFIGFAGLRNGNELPTTNNGFRQEQWNFPPTEESGLQSRESEYTHTEESGLQTPPTEDNHTLPRRDPR